MDLLPPRIHSMQTQDMLGERLLGLHRLSFTIHQEEDMETLGMITTALTEKTRNTTRREKKTLLTIRIAAVDTSTQ